MTPIEQMERESIERSSKLSKKPRVPKVAELLPDAKLIIPDKNYSSEEELVRSPSPQNKSKKVLGTSPSKPKQQ